MVQPAGISFTIKDFSHFMETVSQFRSGIIGRFERGAIGKTYYIGSAPQLERYFGKSLSGIDDLQIIKRALDRGAKLYITRAGHYTDPSDATTLAFTKSSTTLQDRGSSYAYKTLGSTNKAKFTSRLQGTDGNAITVAQDGNGNSQTFGISVSDTDIVITLETNGDGVVQTTVSEMVDAVNAHVLAKTLVYAEVIANGSSAAENVSETSLTGGGAGTNTAKISAKSEGDWSAGGRLAFLISTSSADSDRFNLAVSYSRQPDLAKTYKDLSMNPEDERYAPTILAGDELIEFEDLAEGTGSSDWGARCPRNSAGGTEESFATSGAADQGTITDEDYIGDSGAKTGLHIFDSNDDIMRLAVPASTSHDVWVGGVGIAANREDFVFVHSAPANLTAAQAADWAERRGDYSGGTAQYSAYAFLGFGGLWVPHPAKKKILISATADIIGAHAYSHQQHEYKAKAGLNRGFIPNVLEIYDNIGSQGRRTDAELLADAHVNPIAAFSNEPACLWDELTRQKTTSRMMYLHTVDLLLTFKKACNKFYRVDLFEPHLPKTWRLFYQQIKPWLDSVAAKDGLEGGEGVGYEIRCDQDASNPDDAVLNTSDKRENGEFVAQIFIKETNAIRTIGIQAILTKYGVNFSEVYDLAK